MENLDNLERIEKADISRITNSTLQKFDQPVPRLSMGNVREVECPKANNLTEIQQEVKRLQNNLQRLKMKNIIDAKIEVIDALMDKKSQDQPISRSALVFLFFLFISFQLSY